MEYRSFGRLDFRPSALGFGCMRLPTLGDPAKIDEAEAIRMIRYAIDNGVNYLDSAYGYHRGQSERLLGKALQDGYRQKVKIATKVPSWAVSERADFDRILGEQLERLQTDHIDFYLMHNLNKANWARMKELDACAWAERMIAQGRIGHLGFSFHDTFEQFKRILDEYDGWTMCQIQYNYMNEKTQAGTAGLRYAAAKGLAVVVMEPLLGGRLADLPSEVRAIFEQATPKRSLAEWGLQWVWNQPEVSLVLSGMSTMQQVQENVASASRSGVGKLTAEELQIIEAARDKYNEICPIPCTQCRYCMPCPNGVDIPGNFSNFNVGIVHQKLENSRARYADMKPEERASACIGCRECEDKCPQSIPISQWMPLIHNVLGKGKEYDANVCQQLRVN